MQHQTNLKLAHFSLFSLFIYEYRCNDKWVRSYTGIQIITEIGYDKCRKKMVFYSLVVTSICTSYMPFAKEQKTVSSNSTSKQIQMKQ